MSKFGTWAVVPVKSFAMSKSRLADLWDSNDRAALSAAMLRDVLSALCAVSELAGISVVSAEPKVARIAQAFGAEAIHDTAEIGQASQSPLSRGRWRIRVHVQCWRLWVTCL